MLPSAVINERITNGISTVIPDELIGLVEQLHNFARTKPSDIQASCPEHTFTVISDSDFIEVQTGIFVITLPYRICSPTSLLPYVYRGVCSRGVKETGKRSEELTKI